MPTFQFTNNETGENFDVDFDSEPTEADLQHVQSQLDVAPALGTSQSLGSSALNEGLRALAKVGTGTVEGLGQFGDLYTRRLNPVGWAASLGVPGAQEAVDLYSSIPRGIASTADTAQQAVEEFLPVNPLHTDSAATKLAGVTGQVGGQLGTILTGAAFTKAPAVLQALGLGQAGLLGMETGYQEADRLGISGWERDALATAYGAAEAGVESMGGFGSRGFMQGLVGDLRDAVAGNAIRRFAKTALIEGVEEPITGSLQALSSNVFAQEDPSNPGFSVNGQPLPTIDPTSEEFWKTRAEEFALGTFGGGLFGAANIALSPSEQQRNRNLHQRALLTIAMMREKPNRTAEEDAELAELEREYGNFSSALLPENAIDVDSALVTEEPVLPETITPEAAMEEAPREYDLSEFTPEEFLAEGSESTVYRRGDTVFKVGEAYNDPNSYDSRVESILLGDRELGSGNLKVAGHYVENGVKNPIFTQPFIEGAPATQEQINQHLAAKGFVPVPGRRIFVKRTPEGKILAASDLDGDNVKVLPDGRTEVIDATVFEPTITPEIEQALATPQTQINAPTTDLSQQPQVSQPTFQTQTPQTPSSPTRPELDNLVSTARAVVDSQKGTLPSAQDAWVGTRNELMADKEARAAFIKFEMKEDPDATEESASKIFDSFKTNPSIKGLTFGGRVYILADRVAQLKKHDSFEEAIKKVLRHEDAHIAIEAIVDSNPKLKSKWNSFKRRISPEKLDSLVRRRYPMFSDWRKNSQSLDRLVHEYFAEQMERDEAGESVDDPDLLKQFIAFMKKVLARVTGKDVSLEEIREFVRAGREARAAQLAQRSGPYRASLEEGSLVPEMPKGSVELITHESPYPGMTSQKIAEYAWPRFYASWTSNLEDPDAPLTAEQRAQLESEWRTELADENAMEIAASNAFMEERRSKTDLGLYSPESSQTTEETEGTSTRFSLAEQDPVERLKEINQAFSYATQVGQQEGLDPTKATQDQRKFTSTGQPVDFSRASLPDAAREAMTAETIDLLSDFSPDGKSKTFGRDLMAYLSGQTPDIYGQRLNDLQQVSILNHLDFAVQERAIMGIDGAEVQRIRSQRLSQAGATLQTAASSIYEPLRAISDKAKELTDKKLKEEGVNPEKMNGEIRTEVKAAQTELAKDISTPEVKSSILAGAENEADDLWELGLGGLDPKYAAMIRERDMRIIRLGQLRKLEAMLSGGPRGAKASLAALPENMTLEEVRAMIVKEKSEIEKLESQIEEATKKEKRKAKQAKDREKLDNATFSAWVMGGESAGVDKFDDVMKRYIDPNGFNRFQFTTLLTNSFKNADPNFIMGVVERVADYIDGAATEEGIALDAAKTPNYDARAKRRVATEIAQSSTPEVIELKKDPFTELTKQRLKGEISAENFQKELVKLGLEQETAYAYLQKVDQDRARIGDAKAQRELNAQAKKDMVAFRRASEKSDREAKSQIDALAKQFSDTPNLSKAQATSDLKLAANSFLGKEGPPITEEEFLSRLEKLNVTDQNAQKLLKLLQESRRRDSAVRYAKAVQKAQEARKKAIESAVKKLAKTGQGNQTKLRQRSTFVNSLAGLLEGGIMDSETVRQAFAQAYELHGLTPETLKTLGTQMAKILVMKEGMVKETLLNQFNVTLNEVAPLSSLTTHAHTALMGYILSGLNTMLMQLTGVNRYINPLSNTVEILFSAPGTTAEKIGRTMNPKNFFRLYFDGLKEVGANLAQVQAGMSGMISSAGKGVGAMPSNLASMNVRDKSLSWTPWGQLSKYRFESPKLLEQMGLDKFVQATRYPAWMVSRSFQAIRAAEGIIGGADKNMQWRAQMTTALMQKDPKLTWTDAYTKVSGALGDKTTEMWAEAYKQADEEIKAGTVAKLSRTQRATELVQDKIEEQWEADLKNRPREIAALYGYKQDPITPAGAFVYQGLSRFLNQDKGVMQYAKFSFLFARFFANAIETAYTRTPMGGLMALALPTEKAQSQMTEREKKIEEIYGSLGAYRDARIARAVSGTAFMGAVAGLMALALKDWDPEDDEAPFFWVTGDPIGEFSKKGQLEAGGWWKANTLYLGPIRLNYVNASPEMATVMGAMGAMGDRFLFDKLLNYRENKETGEYERSSYESYGKPVLEALAAPISRSTYRQWYDAIEAAYDGDFKKMTRIVSNPVVGTAVALSPVALIPSVKTLEKMDRSTEQPRTPRSAAQAVMASVPFASELGLDAGKPLTTPFGNPLTPYPFWSIFSNAQEVPPEVGKAARTLADLGVARLGPKEEYFGWGMAEIAHDGRKFLLSDSQRARVLANIGTKFARLINKNSAKLKKIEAGKDGRDKVRYEISKYAKEARSLALAGFRPTR